MFYRRVSKEANNRDPDPIRSDMTLTTSTASTVPTEKVSRKGLGSGGRGKGRILKLNFQKVAVSVLFVCCHFNWRGNEVLEALHKLPLSGCQNYPVRVMMALDNLE